MEMLEDKNVEIKNWQRKYNELYISKKLNNLDKSKVKAPDNTNNKIVEGKLRELMQERESEKKKYV